ncbi:MAG TPA: response regulator transcription factor [Micromonosporaceae bacterium]|nr:response regulator transcription factor [Micromonosporaceae bacterium]
MRVLVVEDNLKMAALLRRGLQEAGYAVDVASDDETATTLGLDVDYDAIVLDIVLGGGDGVEVCRRLRNAGRWAPIVMVTARDGVADRVRGLDAGADDYLTKPFHFDELLARIRAASRRSTAERPVALVVGDLRLDPASHEARRGDWGIDLTAKEFALLECLMRHAGQPLSRTRLIEHLWDFAYDYDSNVVDVHIRNLRKKIDEPFGRNTVQTVRGVGYQIRDDGLATRTA